MNLITSKSRNLILLIIMYIFVFMIIYMLFYNLGQGFLLQTDEAYHATNAYEMYKSGNWIINTYRYETDYFNSKPPLCLDLMILSYKAFGVSGFSARFPSAVGALLTLILIVVFLFRVKDIHAATIPGIAFQLHSTFYIPHVQGGRHGLFFQSIFHIGNDQLVSHADKF